MGPATVGNIMACSDSDSTGCRMDGVVKAEMIPQEVIAFACCRLKTA
jgi:MmpS family membrane protein